MVVSSGFQGGPGHAASGDAACIASTPPHGHVLSGRASFGYSTLASEEKASEK